MAYEQKPGQGAIFKNERKQKDTHPDYTGTYRHHDGSEWQVAVWVKDGRKGKFFSLATSEPRQTQNQPKDDLPF